LEIVKIDPERQRIGLSLKRVPDEEQAAWSAAQAAPAPESTTTADESAATADESTATADESAATADEAADLPADDTGDTTGESQLETIEKEPVA
jgi:hypothetical protein